MHTVCICMLAGVWLRALPAANLNLKHKGVLGHLFPGKNRADLLLIETLNVKYHELTTLVLLKDAKQYIYLTHNSYFENVNLKQDL